MNAAKHANVPFFIPHIGCSHRCSFCNQCAITSSVTAPTAGEVKTVLEQALKKMGERARHSEIAFFGGSFTAIPQQQMVDYLSAASGFIGAEGFHGIRISTRPDAIDKHILNLLKEYGVTAVELGAQSMDDAVLAQNHRGHTVCQIESAAKLIRQEGFELGLQMMTGLPGDSDEGAVCTAEKMIRLAPDTVRIYPTVVLKGTMLARLFEAGEYAPQTLDQAVSLCAGLLLRFAEHQIRVIRLGLQSIDRDAYIAGPFHPAFRELCEGKLLLDRALCQIHDNQIFRGKISIFVHPSCLSKMAGQNRRNLAALESRGYFSKIYSDATLLPYECRVLPR